MPRGRWYLKLRPTSRISLARRAEALVSPGSVNPGSYGLFDLPGPALPAYVIDLPDGSGKVPVESLEHRGGRRYRDPRSGFEFEDIG